MKSLAVTALVVLNWLCWVVNCYIGTHDALIPRWAFEHFWKR